jgi:uracil-DNA glycosylase
VADAPTLPQQLKQYLDALRAAGVEYVAKAGPAPSRKSAPKAVATAVVATVDPLAERRLGLKLLADEIQNCARCLELFSTRTQTVSGVGPISATVAFLGDGPDSSDDHAGEPFRGDAGTWLTPVLVALGLEREQVYLLNATRCRAPGKRFPTAKECANCRDYLVRELELARPKVICCLGTLTAQTLLQTTESIATLRGKVFDYAGIPVVCTFHPAYLLKNPKSAADAATDLELLKQFLGT